MPFNRFAGGLLPPHPNETHPRLYMNALLAPVRLEAIPDTVDFCSEVTSWDMDGNDGAGDCVVAGADHARVALGTYAGNPVQSWGRQGCLDIYSELSGYNQQTGENDTGLNIQDFLGRWRRDGFNGSKILGFGALQPGSWTRAERVKALYTFGGLLLGGGLPESAEEQFPGPWEHVAGSPTAGGHCTWTAAEFRTRDELRIVSWGEAVPSSKAFFMDYLSRQGEAWVIVTEDFIEKNGQNPSGFDLQAMNDALASLTRERNPLGLKSVN